MPENDCSGLTPRLEDLSQAVGANAGAALFVDDGDGTLQLATSVGPSHVRPDGFLGRFRAGHTDDDRQTLIVRLPGVAGGIVVLSRNSGGEFTQQDRAVARVHARGFSDEALVASPIAKTGWPRRLETIQRIGSRLTRLASLEEVASLFCTEICEAIDNDEAHFLVVDATGHLQRAGATAFNVFGNETVAHLPTDGAGGDQIGRALRGGVANLLPDLPDLGPGRLGTHSMLIMPLCYESRVTGVICLVARGRGRFDDDDLRLMQILSDQAAVAIENARLLQGRDDLVHELSGLLEISQASAAAHDEVALAALLCARLRQQTGTDASLVARWEEGSTVMRVICGEDGRPSDQTIDVADSAARREVLRDGRPVIVQAASREVPVESAELRATGGQSLILLPLNAGGRTIGIVELLSRTAPRNPSAAELKVCEAMTSLAAAGLEKVRVLEQLRSAADMDLVTGVHNHRYLQERLRQEIARSARSHSPLAVLMLDLDQFKPINDRHGHADGDRVLHAIAATIRDHLRSSDIVARYGGDEFVVLMPDTGDDAAEQVARRVVGGILKQRQQLSDGTQVTVGVSAGLAVYPADGRTSAQLLQSADSAMYTAKRTGGRQVERSSREPIPLLVSAT